MARKLVRGGHEDLSRGRGIGALGRGRSRGLRGCFEIAEAAELVGDAAERGLGEELRRLGGGGMEGREPSVRVAEFGGGDGKREEERGGEEGGGLVFHKSNSCLLHQII